MDHLVYKILYLFAFNIAHRLIRHSPNEAVAEIATNRKVEGGGDYYVISRSFGLNIGAAIGIALYFSQAISIAFYIIAFSEAFIPLGEYLSNSYLSNFSWSIYLTNSKAIGLISMILSSSPKTHLVFWLSFLRLLK